MSVPVLVFGDVELLLLNYCAFHMRESYMPD